MSRRPADKAAQNQQVIKNLLKLETNKHCADCKRNKHPRWASWNLGVFICIRCSGIHRGMGTHISRVKSVDLDAWTDEQLQSIMKWGNARANRYWESKLASGHVPSDAKIENFIRTKYESRRWVMEGPMPDPSTLGGDGDEDVPLTTVQEKARLDRSASQRVSSAPSQPGQVRRAQASNTSNNFNLIDGGDIAPVPQRASTTEPPSTARAPPPKAAAQPSQLLGGIDFLGGPPDRPSSTSSGLGSMSRPDLKQSILSLYASKPVAQPVAQASQAHSRQNSAATGNNAGASNAFGGLNDAFGGLTFGSTSTPSTKPMPVPQLQAQKQPQANVPKAQPAQPGAYAALTGVLSSPQSTNSGSQVTSPQTLASGNFFDVGSNPAPKQASAAPKANAAPPLMTNNSTDDWGDFSIAAEPVSSPPIRQPKPKDSGLLDFTSGAAAGFSAPQATQSSGTAGSSVFNLSSKPTPAATVAPAAAAPTSNFPSDPWGSNEWNTPDPVPTTSQMPPPANVPAVKPAQPSANDFGWSGSSDWGAPSPATTTAPKVTALDTGGWGDPAPAAPTGGFGELGGLASTSMAPKIQPEEDFGWGSTQATPAPAPAPKPSTSTGGAASNSDDLFANVWG